MSVATWDQDSGTMTFFISKTTVPSGLTMRDVRGVKVMPANASWPGCVNRREICIRTAPWDKRHLFILTGPQAEGSRGGVTSRQFGLLPDGKSQSYPLQRLGKAFRRPFPRPEPDGVWHLGTRNIDRGVSSPNSLRK